MIQLLVLLLLSGTLTCGQPKNVRKGVKPLRVGLKIVLDKINLPTVIKMERFPGDAEESIVVTTQPGEIYLIKQGKSRKIVDISHQKGGDVLQLGNIAGMSDRTYDERGLLGIEFHPDFYKNGRFFLYFSTLDNPNKLQDPPTPDCCKPETLKVRWEDETQYSHVNVVEEWHYKNARTIKKVGRFLAIKHPFSNHNSINNLHWSKELNKLILLTGDGGFRDGPFNLSQDLGYFHGKVIALDTDAPSWKEYSPKPVTRFAELPESINRSLQVLIKGVRNWSGITEFRAGDEISTKFVGQPGQDAVEAIFAFKEWSQPHQKPLNFGWRGWEGSWPSLQNIDCTTRNFTMKASPFVRPTFYHEAVAVSIERRQPYCEYYHLDSRPGKVQAVCITGQQVYQGTKLKGLTNHLIISDWAKTVGVGFPVGKPTPFGFLLHVPIDNQLTELHDYHRLEIAYTFKKPAYFVSLGANKQQTRIFLGVYQTAGTTTPLLGTVFELVPPK